MVQCYPWYNNAPNMFTTDPQKAPLTLAKLQDPMKKGLQSVTSDIKPIYKTLGMYSKALDKVRRDRYQHGVRLQRLTAGGRSSKTNPSHPPTTMPYPRTPTS